MSEQSLSTSIVREFGSVRLSIYDAGTYKTDDGELKEYSAGIKLTKGSYGLKLSAHELASMFQVLRTDEEVRKALEARLKAEKQLVNSTSF